MEVLFVPASSWLTKKVQKNSKNIVWPLPLWTMENLVYRNGYPGTIRWKIPLSKPGLQAPKWPFVMHQFWIVIYATDTYYPFPRRTRNKPD